MLLDLVDDGLILQDGSVVCEVDLCWLFRQYYDLATGVFVALLKGLEGGDCLATETEGGSDFGPIELECCTAL